MRLEELLGARAKGAGEYIAKFAATFGVTGMKHPDRIPNTRRALAIAEWAREQGKLDAWRQAAMSAHWERGMDIEADADLRALAKEVGLDPDAAIAAADDAKYQAIIDTVRAESHAIGVTGIPTFVFPESNLGIVGCQPYDSLAEVAQEAGAHRKTGDGPS